MLQSLSLENFRNHRKLELALERVTILIGPNGAGKSNILEAISLLSSCRSFREDDKKCLVNLDCSFGRVKGDDLEVFIQKEPVALMKVKEKGLWKRQASFVGALRSVVFSPETMALITGTPKIRRRFLDLMISQKNKGYLVALIAYEKIKSQRNSLLQRIRDHEASENELDFWDQGLIREGNIITAERSDTIGFLNSVISGIYQEISGATTDNLEIVYAKNDIQIGNTKLNRQKEIWQGRTLYGPHLDDIAINLNNRPVANFASRGEIRSAVLAMKIGELNFLEEEKEKPPILLLDDVFSEFDQSRRSHLGKLVTNYQTIITVTDKAYLSDWLVREAKIIEV